MGPTLAVAELLDEESVSALLGVSRRQLRRWAAAGKIRRVVLGPRLIRYHPQHIEEFFAQHVGEVAVVTSVKPATEAMLPETSRQR